MMAWWRISATVLSFAQLGFASETRKCPKDLSAWDQLRKKIAASVTDTNFFQRRLMLRNEVVSCIGDFDQTSSNVQDKEAVNSCMQNTVHFLEQIGEAYSQTEQDAIQTKIPNFLLDQRFSHSL